MSHLVSPTLPGSQAMAQLQTKFRARFGQRLYQELMTTARLEHGQSTDSRVVISVEGANVANKLGTDDFLPSLRQIWSAMTGRPVQVQITYRSFIQSKRKEEAPRPKHFVVNPREIRPELVEKFLQGQSAISVRACQQLVAEAYGIEVKALLEKRRYRDLVRARQIAMYLARVLADKTFPEIDHSFKGRNHTTVLHATRKVEKLRSKDPGFDAEVRLYIDILRRVGESANC